MEDPEEDTDPRVAEAVASKRDAVTPDAVDDIRRPPFWFSLIWFFAAALYIVAEVPIIME